MKKPKSMDYMKYERSMGMDRTPDKIQQLEATNKQLIDALVEAKKAIEYVPEDALGIATTSDGSTNYYVVDELLHHIKQSLRNAGVNEENP